MMLSSFFIRLLTILMVSFMLSLYISPIKLDYLSFPNGVVEVYMFCEFNPLLDVLITEIVHFDEAQGCEGVLCFS